MELSNKLFCKVLALLFSPLAPRILCKNSAAPATVETKRHLFLDSCIRVVFLIYSLLQVLTSLEGLFLLIGSRFAGKAEQLRNRQKNVFEVP